MEPVREASRCVSYGSDQRQEKLTEPCKEKLAEENDDLSLVLQFKSNPLGFKSERLKGKRLSSKSADFKSENAVKSEMSRLLFSIKESEWLEKPTNQFAAALPTMQCRVTIEPKEHRPLSESNDWAEVQRKEAILKRTASRGEKRSIASVTDSNYCNRRKMQKVGGSTRPTKQPGLHKDIKDNVKRARKLSLQGKVRTLPFLSKEQPEDSVGNDSGDVEEGQKKPKPKDKDLEVEDMEVDQENSCQKECTFTSQQGSTGLLSEVANLTSGMAGLSVSPQKQKMEPVREASRCVSYGSDQRQEKLTEPCKEKLAEEHDDTSLVLQFKSNPLGFKSERLKEKRLSSKRVDNSRNIIDNNPIINSNLNSRHQISSSDNNYNESCSDNMNETMSHDCHVSQKFGKASLYISTSWKQIIDSCPKQGKGKLIEIMKLLNVEGDGNAKLSDSECGQLLDHLKAFPIEFLEDISVLVYPHLYKLQSEIIHDYDGLSRVPEGYLIYLPPEAAGLEPFQSSTLGNCLWCSLSIVLQGDEHCQNQLRLGAAVATLCNMKAFTKHISVQFCSSDEALAWAGTVAARDEIFTPLLGLQSPSDIISGVISEEIKETLKNFSYSGLFQVVMAAQFLQREIRQYCCKPGADHYNSAVTPLIYTDPTESHRLKPVNILWVPAILGEDTYNHIVPLLPCRPLPQNSRRVLAKKGVKNNDFVS